jgi:ribosome-associated protein
MEFKLKTEYIELIQLLKAAGVSQTGGHAKLIVEEGLVSVNGIIESRKRAKLRPGDSVEVQGKKIRIT